MDPLHPLRRHRRRPLYQLNRADPSTYLTTARIHLLRSLPRTHRLHSRTTPAGQLKPPHVLSPDTPRVPFTDAELAEIRMKRRYHGDPDDVRYQLQESKLVQMWNADYECEEQWREYDTARPVMEYKRDVSGLPVEMFHTDEIVGEKRRRRSSISEVDARKTVVDGTVVESVELEDGEISDEPGYVGDSDEREDDEGEAQEELLRRLREQNNTLRTANDMMRIVAESLKNNEEEAQSSPASPSTARSEHSDSSEDGSANSDMAICDFDLDDLDDEGGDVEDNYDEDLDSEDDEVNLSVVPAIRINAWLGKVDSDSSKKILAMKDESEETQSGHELG